MADFDYSKIPDIDAPDGTSAYVGTTGTVNASKRLLGDDGAAAAGNGQWFRSNGLWKTFMLYPLDRNSATGLGGAVDVRIEACMELASAPDDPDADTFVVELAALSQGTPNFSTENPWRYVRARVVNAGGGTVQVGMHEQGQG